MPEHSTLNGAGLEVRLLHRIGALTLDVQFVTQAAQTVLFGPSGAGKTTILRCIAGLQEPTRGSVRFDGTMLLDTARKYSAAPRARGVGFVMQHTALFPHMTVSENVAYGIHGLGATERHARIMEALELCMAGSLADRRATELSGGEKQRIAIARAIAPRPKLLLLDEPFTGMDLRLRSDLVPRVSHWASEHSVATLYVTHELPEVFELQAEVIVIENGAIARQGPAIEVLQREREHLLQRLGTTVSLFR